ncbi:MAG: ArsR/SmtB family transcription factor [Sphingomonadaceae bacterium]
MLTESVLKALADPTRLRIMRLLSSMELAVGELAHVLAQSQPRVSRHIAILCDVGLAERRREGSWVFLRETASRAGTGSLLGQIEHLLDAAEHDDPEFAQICDSDRRHLAQIRESRELHAAEYFARNAQSWDSLRAMLAPAGEVEAALSEALGPNPPGQVLDIGTGTGRIAELLCPNAEHVVALDKSPEMLRLARARLQDMPPDSVELIQGDFTSLPFDEARFDTVIFHQVLHYAHEPAYALAEAARVCKPGGRIAIVDLATHDQEELRTVHAHARLGFSDQQMTALLSDQGFTPCPPRSVNGGKLQVCVWTGTRRPPSVARIKADHSLTIPPTKKAHAR